MRKDGGWDPPPPAHRFDSMTQQTPPIEPAVPPPTELAAARPTAPTTARLIGVDLARCLAVFGMYVAHVGPDPADGGVTGTLAEVAHGRSATLFALLAGVTLVIIGGRRTPKTGLAGRQAAAKIVIRSVILVVLGTMLTMTGTGVEVILAYYGLYFLLALPLIRLRARGLALVAAVWALAGPQLSYVIQVSLDNGGFARAVRTYDPLTRLSDEGILELLFTGAYPALTYMPFMVAGMALGRLDLASAAVRVRLAVLGPALAIVGYGGSWLALHILPGIVEATHAPQAWWSDVDGDPSGDTAAWLLAASPHSGTTLSVVANTGVAITVIVTMLAAMDLPRLRRLATPMIAVGTMSLTAYVLHIVGLWAAGIKELPDWPLHVVFGLILVVTALAFAWSRFFRRGPLEFLVNAASNAARYVR